MVLDAALWATLEVGVSVDERSWNAAGFSSKVDVSRLVTLIVGTIVRRGKLLSATILFPIG